MWLRYSKSALLLAELLPQLNMFELVQQTPKTNPLILYIPLKKNTHLKCKRLVETRQCTLEQGTRSL